MKNNNQIDYTIDIDYDMFTTEEIIKIYEFYHQIAIYQNTGKNKNAVLSSYEQYRKIINNTSLEKKYDKTFYIKTNVSIYNLIKKLKN